jgi:tetratricopeptide (TPR) repeat protein
MDSLQDSVLASARERAAAGAWPEVAALLAPRVQGRCGMTEDTVLMAEAILYLGEERRAQDLLRTVLSDARTMPDASLHRRAVNMLGVACFALGELDEAMSALNAALELSARDDDPALLAKATNNLGAIANLQGRHEDALWHYRLALPTLQRVGDRRRLAQAYHNIGITFRDTGDLDESDEHERRAIEYATEGGDTRLAAMGRVGRAEVALRRGDAELAETTARLAREEFGRIHDPLNEADALRLVGAACGAQQRYDESLDAFDRALELARARGHALAEAETLRDRATVWLARNERARAREDARRAMEIFGRAGAEGERAKLEKLGLG